MKLAFQVSTSPGVLHSTTKSERDYILRSIVLYSMKKEPQHAQEKTWGVKQNLLITINWAKKFIVFVTKDEADDWFPVLC
jgi:hypothetical protein